MDLGGRREEDLSFTTKCVATGSITLGVSNRMVAYLGTAVK